MKMARDLKNTSVKKTLEAMGVGGEGGDREQGGEMAQTM
jgi:hypothetical protein